MLLKNYSPSDALWEYVRCYEVVHFIFEPNMEIPVKPFAPRGENSLCFFPRDPDHVSNFGSNQLMIQPKTIICGQQTLMKMRRPGRDFLLIMVSFQPGVLFRLTGVPQHLLTDEYVDAEILLTKEIKYVNESLNDCHSYRQMIEVVESFLLMLIKRIGDQIHSVDRTARFILQHPTSLPIVSLAKEACLSLRQFERRFKDHLGICPSQFSRISKFDKTVKLKNAQPSKDWLSIALECGYYDYQHLVRDYKEFTGLTPTSFFELDINAPERIFGLFEESEVHTF